MLNILLKTALRAVNAWIDELESDLHILSLTYVANTILSRDDGTVPSAIKMIGELMSKLIPLKAELELMQKVLSVPTIMDSEVRELVMGLYQKYQNFAGKYILTQAAVMVAMI